MRAINNYLFDNIITVQLRIHELILRHEERII